jgi:hypothetical protein
LVWRLLDHPPSRMMTTFVKPQGTLIVVVCS